MNAKIIFWGVKKNLYIFKEEMLGKRKKTDQNLPAGIKNCMKVFNDQFHIIMKFNQKEYKLLLFRFRVLFAFWIMESIFVGNE